MTTRPILVILSSCFQARNEFCVRILILDRQILGVAEFLLLVFSIGSCVLHNGYKAGCHRILLLLSRKEHILSIDLGPMALILLLVLCIAYYVLNNDCKADSHHILPFS
jgi:hypothetical protein